VKVPREKGNGQTKLLFHGGQKKTESDPTWWGSIGIQGRKNKRNTGVKRWWPFIVGKKGPAKTKKEAPLIDHNRGEKGI